MKSKNGKPIHSGRLMKSSPDTVALGQAVEDRFLRLCQVYEKNTGNRLPIPLEIRHDILHWRVMLMRHRRGDHRNTEAQLQATRAMAQWTVDENNLLCGQKPVKLEWRD